MTSRVLAVDVGNSRIKLGLLERPADPQSLPQCLRVEAIPHDAVACREALAAFEYAPAVDWPSVGVVAGVNPRAVQIVLDNWPRARWAEPLVLDDPSRLPIAVRVNEPQQVGIDRALNALAANVLRPPGRPAIVVDCGTATTVDLVSAAGTFEGGAILPGFELAARALHQYTARLPLVPMHELAAEPPDAIGRDTWAAIRSGLVWGQVGAVRELVARLSDAVAGRRSSTPSDRHTDGVELRPTVQPIVLLTGGGAPLLAPHLPHDRLEPCLSLQGLALVAFASLDPGDKGP